MACGTEETVLRDPVPFSANLEDVARFEARNMPVAPCVDCHLPTGHEVALKRSELETDDLATLIGRPVHFERDQLFHAVEHRSWLGDDDDGLLSPHDIAP